LAKPLERPKFAAVVLALDWHGEWSSQSNPQRRGRTAAEIFWVWLRGRDLDTFLLAGILQCRKR
jgi:hypothetical protein